MNSTLWNFATSSGLVNRKGNMVSDILFSNFKGVSGDARIATVTFSAKRTGKTAIRLKPSEINPFASNGSVLDVKFQKTKIIVSKNK
ncbi:hypothetical protein [Oceanicoccus sagamiensis]|nr:hypothetical protein [Oceanicoccus sagamiensis]